MNKEEFLKDIKDISSKNKNSTNSSNASNSSLETLDRISEYSNILTELLVSTSHKASNFFVSIKDKIKNIISRISLQSLEKVLVKQNRYNKEIESQLIYLRKEVEYLKSIINKNNVGSK